MHPTTETAGPESVPTETEITGENQRERFYRILPRLLAEHDHLAAVLADVGVGYLDPGETAAVAERVVNVGIREQLMIGVAGGLALTGLRPIVHTFAPFLLDRPFEQVKLDLDHQGVGAVLVSAGASYDWPTGGQTHFGHRDVALLDTLSGWTVHVPGHPDEAEALLRRAAVEDGRVYIRLAGSGNSRPLAAEDGRMRVLRRGGRATVIAVGPLAERTLAATEGLDVTVLYAATVRPFDQRTLRAVLDEPDVVLVEPYLRGSSAGQVGEALADVRHRVLSLGVGPDETRRYGSYELHDRLHGIDAASIRRSVVGLIDGPA